MASTDGTSPSSAPHTLRSILSSSSPGRHAAADMKPVLPPPPAPLPSPPGGRKKGLTAAAFRGLLCASVSASRAYSPAAAAVRSSADWQGKRQRRRRKKKKGRRGEVGGDVWCAPGIPFAAEASVDCVAAHQPMAGRGRPDAGERIHRERPYIPRRISHQEQILSFMDSPPNLDTPFIERDLLPSEHLRHLREYHRTPSGVEEGCCPNIWYTAGIQEVAASIFDTGSEKTHGPSIEKVTDLTSQIMMFQTRDLFGRRRNLYDQFRDWRLDVDSMSYEELLELGDKIGHVSTGLREEEITSSLSKMKQSASDASATRHASAETQLKCSICQEEYEVNDETGRLECGHNYHMYCIKQWLLLKNACPVCKTPALKT